MKQVSTEQLLQVNNQTLFVKHTITDTSAPTLVFLHDSLGCTTLWRDFPETLASALSFNFLVYDRLGYGRSEPMPSSERETDYLSQEALLLPELLNACKVKRPILVGHSDGGSIALIAAAYFPELFEAVIVEAAHIFVEAVTLLGIKNALKDYAETDLSVRLAKYHGDKERTIFEAWTKIWQEPAFQTWNIESLLPKIKCPLLFVQGTLDEFATVEQVHRTVDQVSGYAETLMINHCGHTPHKEAKAETMTGMINFLKQHITPNKVVAFKNF